jgi:ABC-type dipeptide/oligopeptide/nickel transport system permease component
MSILTVDSLGSQKKDIIIFMGTLYIGAVATTFAALFNDLLVAIFDPRIKLS